MEEDEEEEEEDDDYDPLSYKKLMKHIEHYHPRHPETKKKFSVCDRITLKDYNKRLFDPCLCYVVV